MLAVLDLFSEQEPSWTPDAIGQRLDCSLPTAYRYVRALLQAGLLRRAGAGSYVLGPRVVELDFQMRQTDPLITLGRPALQALCDDTGCDVVLAELHGDRVITTHQLHGREGVSASYGRGRRMPSFRGMLSKMLLASLPRARVRKLRESQAEAAAAEPFARDADAMYAALKAIRAQGWCVSKGELDPELVGVAVPLAARGDGDPAALGVIVSRQRFATIDLEALVARMRVTAETVAQAVAHGATDRRDRAVPLSAASSPSAS